MTLSCSSTSPLSRKPRRPSLSKCTGSLLSALPLLSLLLPFGASTLLVCLGVPSLAVSLSSSGREDAGAGFAAGDRRDGGVALLPPRFSSGSLCGALGVALSGIGFACPEAAGAGVAAPAGAASSSSI